MLEIKRDNTEKPGTILSVYGTGAPDAVVEGPYFS